jgi:hypothetical protein
VTFITDGSFDLSQTLLVNKVWRARKTKALFEPGDTRRQWTGKPRFASLVCGNPVAARTDLQRRLLVPTIAILCSSASTSEATVSFGGDFF